MERLGQEAPSGRQLFMLRMMGLLIPPASAGIVARIRGILLLIAARDRPARGRLRARQADRAAVRRDRHGPRDLLRLPAAWSIVLGVLVLFGRRRQARARAAASRRTRLSRRSGERRAASSVQRGSEPAPVSRASGSSAPSSVKIADHHPPDQVLPLGSGSASWQQLERPLEVAARPRPRRPARDPRRRRGARGPRGRRRRSRPRRPPAARAPPSSSPRSQQEAAELAPGHRVRGVELERAAQRVLVARRRPARPPRRARASRRSARPRPAAARR